jgi:lipoprotein-anchoring transpeptidase ErfK/SrfK
MFQNMFQNKWTLRILIGFAVIVFIFLSLEVLGIILEGRHRVPWQKRLKDQSIDMKVLEEWAANNQRLKKKIDRLGPPGVYLVIDSARNMLYLKKGGNILKSCVISCGSGNVLQEPNGQRRWVFDTPRGEFSVQSKLRDPVWLKPDWAFIEEGKAIPNDNNERIEEGMLGDYALGFGDGYFIHGTLYTRMLGRNVTHGCIRVGDEDLEFVFKAVTMGSKIYIY